MRILVVEDEKSLAEAIQEMLIQHGYETDTVATVFDGMAAAMSNAYDCLLVDVMLPDGDGMEFVRDLREMKYTTPVLMLTARNATFDRVRGLNAGADDYLGKPFDTEELLARMNALIRRASLGQELDVIEQGNAKLYRNSRTLEVDGHVLELSSKEFMLLEYLFRHPRQTLSREQLIAHLWGPEAEVADNALDTYIYFLRKKCAHIGLKHLIQTVRGQGYALISRS